MFVLSLIAALLGSSDYKTRISTERVLYRLPCVVQPVLFYGLADHADAQVRKSIERVISPAWYVTDWSYATLVSRQPPCGPQQYETDNLSDLCRLVKWGGLFDEKLEWLWFTLDYPYTYGYYIVTLKELRNRVVYGMPTITPNIPRQMP